MPRSTSLLCCLGLLPAFALVARPAQASPTWDLVYNEPNQDNALLGVSAVDGSNAWAVGMSSNMGSSQPVGIRTTDGASWGPMFLPASTGGPLEMLFFTALAFNDPSNGYLFGMQVSIAGQQNILWRSTNGGLSWTEIYRPAEMVEQLQALASGQLFAAAGGQVVLSADGQGFQQVAPPLPAGTKAVGIHMMNPTCGYLIAATDDEAPSAQSAVLWTDQGGVAWETRAEGIPARLNRAWFVDANLGWAAGTNDRGAGVVASTRDGGRTWAVTEMPDHPAVMGGSPVPVNSCVDVRFFDDLRGVALCSACTGGCDGATEENPTLLTAFARTADGGTSWQLDPDYEPVMNAGPFGELVKFSGMLSMAFPDPNHGFMVGQNNLVLRYTAAAPEPEGWGPPACAGGTGGNPGTGGSSGVGASGAAPPGADDPGAASDGGCGCLVPGHGSGGGGGGALVLVGALAGLVLGRRQREGRRPSPGSGR